MIVWLMILLILASGIHFVRITGGAATPDNLDGVIKEAKMWCRFLEERMRQECKAQTLPKSPNPCSVS